MNEYSKDKKCYICENENEPARRINLFTHGSEGTDLCHKCEMNVVAHINAMHSNVTYGKLMGYKQALKRK